MTYEYIRGLVESYGQFTFHASSRKIVINGVLEKTVTPAFVLRMHAKNKDLVEAVAKHLDIDPGKVAIYGPYRKDGHKRGQVVSLTVRDLGTLKNVIIPLFRNKLAGNKAKQFIGWLDRIEKDQRVPKSYKLLAKLNKKGGFYDLNPNKYGKT